MHYLLKELLKLTWVLDYENDMFVVRDNKGDYLDPRQIEDPRQNPYYSFGSLVTKNALDAMRKLRESYNEKLSPTIRIPNGKDFSFAAVEFALGNNLFDDSTPRQNSKTQGLRVYLGLIKWGKKSEDWSNYTQTVILTGYTAELNDSFPEGISFSFLKDTNPIVGVEVGNPPPGRDLD